MWRDHERRVQGRTATKGQRVVRVGREQAQRKAGGPGETEAPAAPGRREPRGRAQANQQLQQHSWPFSTREQLGGRSKAQGYSARWRQHFIANRGRQKKAQIPPPLSKLDKDCSCRLAHRTGWFHRGCKSTLPCGYEPGSGISPPTCQPQPSP